jgi:hypothetical protein
MSVTPSTTNSASTAAQAQPTLTPSEWAKKHAPSLKDSQHKEADLMNLLLEHPVHPTTTPAMLHAALNNEGVVISRPMIHNTLTTAQAQPDQELIKWAGTHRESLVKSKHLELNLIDLLLRDPVDRDTTPVLLHAALVRNDIRLIRDIVRNALTAVRTKPDQMLVDWVKTRAMSLKNSHRMEQDLTALLRREKPPDGTISPMLHAALVQNRVRLTRAAVNTALSNTQINARPQRDQADQANEWVKTHVESLKELDNKEPELAALLRQTNLSVGITAPMLRIALTQNDITNISRPAVSKAWAVAQARPTPALVELAKKYERSSDMKQRGVTKLLREHGVPEGTTDLTLQAALIDAGVLINRDSVKAALNTVQPRRDDAKVVHRLPQAKIRAERRAVPASAAASIRNSSGPPPTPPQEVMSWIEGHLMPLIGTGSLEQNLKLAVAKQELPPGTTAGMLHAALAKKNIIVGLRAVKIALPPQPPRHDDAGFLPPSSRPRQKRTAAQANLATPAASIARARAPSGSLASSSAISFNPGARAPGLEEWGDLLDRERPSSTFSAISEFPLGDEVERFMAGSPTPSVDSPEVEDEWASLLQSLVRNEPSSPPFSIASHPSFSTGPDNGRFMMESPLNLRTPYAAGPSAVNPFAPVPGVHPHPVADPFIQPLPLAPLDRDGSADELPRKVLPPRLSAIRFSQVAQRQPGESEHGLIVRVHETHRELSDSDLARALGVPWESVSEAILRDELLRQFNLSAIPEPGAAHAGSAPDPEACKQTDTRLAHTCREQGLKAITNVGLSQHKDGDLVLAWNANDRRQPVVEVRLPRPSLSSASAEPPTSPVASTPQTPTDRLQAELFRELGLSNIEGVSAGYTVPGRDRDLQGARAALAADLAQACQEQKLAAITNVYWSQRTGVVLAWDDNDPSRRVATVRWESPTAELGGRKTS